MTAVVRLPSTEFRSHPEQGQRETWIQAYNRRMANLNADDYRTFVKESRAAAAGMQDSELREIAFKSVLFDKLAKAPDQMQEVNYFDRSENIWTLGIGALLSTLACLSLWHFWPMWTSKSLAVLMCLAILILLLMVGLHSDGKMNTQRFMPHRVPALLFGVLLLIGLLHAFGNMYLHDGGVCPTGQQCKVPTDCLRTQNQARQALYFSCVTMMTIGYGDYVPMWPPTHWLVMWESACGVLLVLFFLPIVMSRISSY